MRGGWRPGGLVACGMMVLFGLGLSVALGKAPIPLAVVWDALTSFDSGSREHLIVQSVRIPRALLAAAVGACLAVAGAIMQAVTRNALAGPELFGVNQGAALAIVIPTFLLDQSSMHGMLASAFAGAAIAGALAYLLGSLGSGGMTPLKLVLAGSTVSLLFGALTQGILVFDEESLDTMRFWMAGSLTGRNTEMFATVAPFMAAGLLIALLLSRQLNLIALHEDAARGLGLRLGRLRLIVLLAVMLLAGGAVATAGPISFIGLAVPHIVRYLVGTDYRWVLPYSACMGAALLLLADVAARFVIPSQEVAAGVMTALIGAPFLIYLAKKGV